MVEAHRKGWVRNTPCAHNPDEEQRAKRRVRRDVEPPEVRRFLRQELLKKVGHSWWNRPWVYRHDLADEREPTLSVRSVVVIPSDLEQPEVSPEQQGSGPSASRDRMTLVGPVASPVTSLPCTPGRDILLPRDAEESPRTKEGRVAVASTEQEMGRHRVAAAIGRSRIGRSPHRRPLWDPSPRKWWPRPATPWSEKETQPPRPCGPRTASLRHRVIQIGREGPKFCQNFLSRDARRR